MALKRTVTNKEVCDALFMPCPDKEEFSVCRADGCGAQIKRNPTGYTNLIAHVRSVHPDTFQLMSTTPSSYSSSLLRFLQPKKGRNLHDWLEIVILGLRPFSTVEDDCLRRHLKLNPICVDTFMKHKAALVVRVENKIANMLPDVFCVVLDGWSCATTHYVALFATYPSDAPNGYCKVLLAFSPMGNEKSLDAETHVTFIEKTLRLYKKSMDNVMAFIGDNVSTNKRAARLAKVAFVGCASHRYNLAVMDLVNDNSELIGKVNALMVFLRSLIPAATLRERTPLQPVTACPTRWGSYHKQLKRYTELREFIPQMDMPDAEDLLPSAAEHRRIASLLDFLEPMEGVSLELQKNRCTMAHVRDCFDMVVQDHPSTRGRLAADAEIVQCKNFEDAVVLIQRQQSHSLTSAQRAAVSMLKRGSVYKASGVHGGEDSGTVSRKRSIVDRVYKRRKQLAAGSGVGYIDTRFIVPTSNMVESFFSKAGRAVTPHMLDLLPIQLEGQMFLYANADVWNIDDLSKVVQAAKPGPEC